MRRRLSYLAHLVSLVVLAGAILLWGRSFMEADEIRWARERRLGQQKVARTIELSSSAGGLRLDDNRAIQVGNTPILAGAVHDRPGLTWEAGAARGYPYVDIDGPIPDLYWNGFVFDLSHDEYQLDPSPWTEPWRLTASRTIVVVPYWSIVVLASLPPTARKVQAWRGRRSGDEASM